MARTRSDKAQFPDGAADIARRFGVTIKTLRLYERAGLLSPVRDGHGWRTYGQVDCERLHLVLLLRRFGLSLARIGELLSAGRPDLAGILDLQAQALEEQRTRVDEALSLIRRARRHMAEHGDLAPAAVAALARVEPRRLRWTPALEAMAVRCFTPAQKRRLAANAAATARVWQAICLDLAAIVDGPCDALQARLVGARAARLIDRMTEGDPALQSALSRFWHDGFADPWLARTLPLDRKSWRFLGQAMAHARTEPDR